MTDLKEALRELNEVAYYAVAKARKSGKPREYINRLSRIAAETDELVDEL